MPVLIFEEKVVKDVPIDGALAGSEAEGCWILVWNCIRRNLSVKNNLMTWQLEVRSETGLSSFQQ
jgi:hypothetical protein